MAVFLRLKSRKLLSSKDYYSCDLLSYIEFDSCWKASKGSSENRSGCLGWIPLETWHTFDCSEWTRKLSPYSLGEKITYEAAKLSSKLEVPSATLSWHPH